MSVSDWSVYYIYNSVHTNPPKNKYAVIFDMIDGYYGFFINSEIHPFILKRSHLLPCIAGISKSSNNWLDYDSYIDCSKMFDFNFGELVTKMGEVSSDTKTNIINAIIACPTLELKYKNHLLQYYGSLSSY